MKVRLRKLLTFILAVALAIPSGFAIQEGGEVKHAKAAEQYKWYCKECGKKFVERPSNHTVSKLAGYRCDSCGQTFDTNVSSHTYKRTRYQCNDCGAILDEQKKHSGQIPEYYCCNTCGQMFSEPDGGSHTRPELLFYCTSCKQYFETVSSFMGTNHASRCDLQPDSNNTYEDDYINNDYSMFITYTRCTKCGAGYKGIHDCNHVTLHGETVTGHLRYKYELPKSLTKEKAYVRCKGIAKPVYQTKEHNGTSYVTVNDDVACSGDLYGSYSNVACNGTIAPITAKVTFDPVLSGLSSTTKDVQVYTDIASTLNSVSYEDTTGKYTFLGWNTDRNATSALTSLQISQNTTLYAIWKLNRHKIKFNTGFSDLTQADRTLDFGSAYGELPNLVKTGYTFRGWYNGNTPVSSSTKMGDSDVTLTASGTEKLTNSHIM